jgi:hypothetical protein
MSLTKIYVDIYCKQLVFDVNKENIFLKHTSCPRVNQKLIVLFNYKSNVYPPTKKKDSGTEKMDVIVTSEDPASK